MDWSFLDSLEIVMSQEKGTVELNIFFIKLYCKFIIVFEYLYLKRTKISTAVVDKFNNCVEIDRGKENINWALSIAGDENHIA